MMAVIVEPEGVIVKEYRENDELWPSATAEMAYPVLGADVQLWKYVVAPLEAACTPVVEQLLRRDARLEARLVGVLFRP
jgi:hypothetical protein